MLLVVIADEVKIYAMYVTALLRCFSNFVHVRGLISGVYVAHAQYHLSPAIVGLVFLASPTFYALASPTWGWIVDIMVWPTLACSIVLSSHPIKKEHYELLMATEYME